MMKSDMLDSAREIVRAYERGGMGLVEELVKVSAAGSVRDYCSAHNDRVVRNYRPEIHKGLSRIVSQRGRNLVTRLDVEDACARAGIQLVGVSRKASPLAVALWEHENPTVAKHAYYAIIPGYFDDKPQPEAVGVDAFDGDAKELYYAVRGTWVWIVKELQRLETLIPSRFTLEVEDEPDPALPYFGQCYARTGKCYEVRM